MAQSIGVGVDLHVEADVIRLRMMGEAKEGLERWVAPWRRRRLRDAMAGTECQAISVRTQSQEK